MVRSEVRGKSKNGKKQKEKHGRVSLYDCSDAPGGEDSLRESAETMREKGYIYLSSTSVLHRRPLRRATNVRVERFVQIFRNPSPSDSGLVRPVVCLLCFEGPGDPTTSRFPSSDLSGPRLAERNFVLLREGGSIARLALAASDVVGTGVSTVVARSDTATYEEEKEGVFSFTN